MWLDHQKVGDIKQCFIIYDMRCRRSSKNCMVQWTANFIYRDSGYPMLIYLQAPHLDKKNVSRDQINYKTAVSKVRITFKRRFGEIKTCLNFLT